MVHYFLLTAMILMTASSLWAVQHVGRTPALTVSLHVAKSRQTILVFGLLFGAATICYALWVFLWLFATIPLGVVGQILYSAIIFCFACVAVFPDIENTSVGAFHKLLAWALVYLFPPTILVTILASSLPLIQVMGSIYLAALFVLLTGYIFVKSQRNYFLYYQTAYVAVFFVFMATLARYS